MSRIRTPHYWKRKDLLKLGEKNKGWAIHCPQYLYRELAEALDKMSYELGIKAEHTAELQYQLDDHVRGSDEKANDRFDMLVKAVKELQPYTIQSPGKRR